MRKTFDRLLSRYVLHKHVESDVTGLAGTYLAVANDLSDLNDAATARSNLGVAIGSDVQAYDATLASIAGLGTAADKMLYTTGVDTWAEASITSAGRALLDDASASDQRTTLGLVAGGAGDIWVEKAGDSMTGNLGVGNSGAAQATLQVIGPDSAAGGTIFSSSLTNGVNKIGRLKGLHYSNSTEEPITLAALVSDISTIQLFVGGGEADENAIKEFYIYNAANNTTLTGSKRVEMLGTSPWTFYPYDNNSVGVKIKGIASQTASLLTIEDSSGNPLMDVGSGGHISINTAADDYKIMSFSETVSGLGADFYAFNGQVTKNDSDARNVWGSLHQAFYKAPSGTQSGELVAYEAAIPHQGAGTVSIAYAAKFRLLLQSTGNLTTGYGLYVQPIKTGGGTFGTCYGLYLADHNVASTNYAIITNAGNIVFNEGGDSATDVRIEGNTDENLFFTDASADGIGIGTNAPAGKLHIKGLIDDQQLIVQGYSSQTVNIIEVQDSSNNVLAKFDAKSHLYLTPTNPTDTSGTIYSLSSVMTPLVTADTTATFQGLYSRVTTMGAKHYSGDIVSMYARVASNATLVDNLYGLWASISVTGGTSTNTYSVYIPTPLGAATITNSYGLYISDHNRGSTLNYAIYTGLGDVRFGDDLLVASPNATVLTLGAGTAGIDYQIKVDGETNDGLITWMEDEDYWRFEDDLVFNSGAGLPYGEISATDANSTVTITTAGKANKVQIAVFDTNGASNNMTPDHTTDDITVTVAGVYLCVVSLHILSAAAGGADSIGYSVYKNNGATELTNLHGQRQLAGGGTDEGSVCLSGIVSLSVNDTIELWMWNNDSTDDFIVDDVTLSLVMIGG